MTEIACRGRCPQRPAVTRATIVWADEDIRPYIEMPKYRHGRTSVSARR